MAAQAFCDIIAGMATMNINDIQQCLARLEAENHRLAERVSNLEEKVDRSSSKPSDQTPPSVVYKPREDELQWLAAHSEVLKKHAGHWIALQGPELVAAGEDLVDVLAAARAKGFELPLTLYLAKDPREYLLGMSNQPID